MPSAHNSSGSGVSQSYYSDSQAIEFCRAAVSDGKIFFKHTKLLNRIGGSTKAINSSALFKRQVINQVEQLKNRQTEIHAYIYLGSMVNRNWRTQNNNPKGKNFHSTRTFTMVVGLCSNSQREGRRGKTKGSLHINLHN